MLLISSVTPYRGKCGRDLITRVEIRGHKILGDIHGQIHGNTIFVDCDFEKYSCDTDCSGHYIIPLSEVECGYSSLLFVRATGGSALHLHSHAAASILLFTFH